MAPLRGLLWLLIAATVLRDHGQSLAVTVSQTPSRSLSGSQTPSQQQTLSSSPSSSSSASPSETASPSMTPSESSSPSQSLTPSQVRTSTQSSSTTRTPSRTQSASASSSPRPAIPSYDPGTRTIGIVLVCFAVLFSASVALVLCWCTSSAKMRSAAERAAEEAEAEQQEHADADDALLTRGTGATMQLVHEGGSGGAAGRRGSTGILSSQDVTPEIGGVGGRAPRMSARRPSTLGMSGPGAPATRRPSAFGAGAPGGVRVTPLQLSGEAQPPPPQASKARTAAPGGASEPLDANDALVSRMLEAGLSDTPSASQLLPRPDSAVSSARPYEEDDSQLYSM